jgi:hypothetical protein
MMANLTMTFFQLETFPKISTGILLCIIYYFTLSKIFKPTSLKESLKCMHMRESAQEK